MFVTTKKDTRSGNIYIQLVESYREGGRMKQRMIRHIGTARTEGEILELKQLGMAIKVEMEQRRLKSQAPEAKGCYAKALGKLSSISPHTKLRLIHAEGTTGYILGIHDIYGFVYDSLNFSNPFSRPKQRVKSAEILREIVLARIANPVSKRATVEMLQEQFLTQLNLDNVYQMMDKIDDAFCDRIQERALAATLCLTGDKLKVLFYDATTLYFESFTEDELKQNGYSKDMKFNQPQVLFALFVTREGLPVGYEVFPGATYEGHTLKPVLEKLKARYQIDEVIFVADRGMLSIENLNFLEKNNIPYIMGARLRSLTHTKQAEVLAWSSKIKEAAQKEENLYKDIEHTNNIEIKDGKRLVLSYSNKRALKDAYDRNKSILKLQKKLSKSKNPKNAISNYGYQKYLQISGNARLEINEEKLEKEAQWDGISGVYTNQLDLTDAEILSHYRSLWQIEESFRITKHDLRIRPIYHWSPKRVRAHIAISFMAFACVRYLEHRIKIQYGKLSPETVRKELLRVQASIIRDKQTGKKYMLPSKLSTEAKHIYRIIGVKPPEQIQAIL
jgi:transposase